MSASIRITHPFHALFGQEIDIGKSLFFQSSQKGCRRKGGHRRLTVVVNVPSHYKACSKREGGGSLQSIFEIRHGEANRMPGFLCSNLGHFHESQQLPNEFSRRYRQVSNIGEGMPRYRRLPRFALRPAQDVLTRREERFSLQCNVQKHIRGIRAIRGNNLDFDVAVSSVTPRR